MVCDTWQPNIFSLAAIKMVVVIWFYLRAVLICYFFNSVVRFVALYVLHKTDVQHFFMVLAIVTKSCDVNLWGGKSKRFIDVN